MQGCEEKEDEEEAGRVGEEDGEGEDGGSRAMGAGTAAMLGHSLASRPPGKTGIRKGLRKWVFQFECGSGTTLKWLWPAGAKGTRCIQG